MTGMVTEPVVTTSAVGLPEIMPYMPDEITATLAGPPGRRPEMAAAKSKKKSAPLAVYSKTPNSTNMKA